MCYEESCSRGGEDQGVEAVAVQPAGNPYPRTRRRQPRCRKPPLTVRLIVAWADEFKRRRGRWPRHSDGRIRPLDETWMAINVAPGRGSGRLSLIRTRLRPEV